MVNEKYFTEEENANPNVCPRDGEVEEEEEVKQDK